MTAKLTAIQTIYPTIKAIPAKALNWQAAYAALRARYAPHDGKISYSKQMALDEMDNARGLRGKRDSITRMAVSIVDDASRRSHRQAPSEESLSWDGFLGGSIEVWTDEEAAEIATAEILAFVKTFAV